MDSCGHGPDLPARSAPMNEIVTSDVLHRLDQRHEELLAELDLLNERLEAALKPFAKPAATDSTAETAGNL